MKKTLLLSFLVILAFGCTNKASTQLLSPDELNTVTTKDISTQLIDVRTTGEFAGGHIPRAKNIELQKNQPEMFEGLDKTRPVYVYCQSGKRSAAAAEKLKERGFTVYDLKNGIAAWRAEGLPEVKPNGNAQRGISMDEFTQTITNELPVFVDFYAPWCGPCIKMAPFIEELREELKGQVEIVKIDVDANADLAAELKITALPVLRIYKNGVESWSYMGYMNKEKLKEAMLK